VQKNAAGRLPAANKKGVEEDEKITVLMLGM